MTNKNTPNLATLLTGLIKDKTPPVERLLPYNGAFTADQVTAAIAKMESTAAEDHVARGGELEKAPKVAVVTKNAVVFALTDPNASTAWAWAEDAAAKYTAHRAGVAIKVAKALEALEIEDPAEKDLVAAENLAVQTGNLKPDDTVKNAAAFLLRCSGDKAAKAVEVMTEKMSDAKAKKARAKLNEARRAFEAAIIEAAEAAGVAVQ